VLTVKGEVGKYLIVHDSVVQLLLTYRPFYKNVTTCGQLTKLCRKQID